VEKILKEPKRNYMTRRWITVKEAASYLSLHPDSIYHLIDRGLIPAGRVGRNIRVDLKALEAMMEEEVARLKSLAK